MARPQLLFLVALAAAPSALGFLGRRSPVTSLADVSAESQASADTLSTTVIEERIRDFRAINPKFSEDSCTAMFDTKVKLGGPVPPADFVKGCTEVCALLKHVKDYWGSGDTADFACERVKNFGCAYEVASQVRVQTGKEIGC